MASRLENRAQYGLLSSGYSGADKTVVQFKLTDSSLKSIEEYLKAKVSVSLLNVTAPADIERKLHIQCIQCQ